MGRKWAENAGEERIVERVALPAEEVERRLIEFGQATTLAAMAQAQASRIADHKAFRAQRNGWADRHRGTKC